MLPEVHEKYQILAAERNHAYCLKYLFYIYEI